MAPGPEVTSAEWHEHLVKLALEAWDRTWGARMDIEPMSREAFERAARERMAQAAQLIAELEGPKETSATDCPYCPKCGLPCGTRESDQISDRSDPRLLSCAACGEVWFGTDEQVVQAKAADAAWRRKR